MSNKLLQFLGLAKDKPEDLAAADMLPRRKAKSPPVEDVKWCGEADPPPEGRHHVANWAGEADPPPEAGHHVAQWAGEADPPEEHDHHAKNWRGEADPPPEGHHQAAGWSGEADMPDPELAAAIRAIEKMEREEKAHPHLH